MARRPQRLRQTLMDYMVIGISPALLMGMVGSLLYFLLTVFYHGQYEARLHFIFAMFTMAIVLIARISMTEGIEYASIFGIALAVVTAMALAKFVQIEGVLAGYSLLINCGLMAIVWWSAHKLTWDCTFIDDRQDASGEGLLQGMGLDAETVERQVGSIQPGGTIQPGGVQSAGESGDASPGVVAQERGRNWYQRVVQRRRRPHTPGVWVMYYALAALPLFGVGQLAIPAGDTASRLHAFQLICVYVACALGLLLTTSFLGLRRYLRQRNLQMPLDMAGVWLGLGALIILAVLLVCTLLPRPGASLSLSQLPFGIGSPARPGTNRQALGNDGPERPAEATRTSPTAQQPPAAAESPPGQKPGESPDGSSGKPSSSPPSAQSSSSSDTKSKSSGDAKSKSSGDAKSDPAQRSSDSPAEQPTPSSDAKSKSDPAQQSSDTASQQSSSAEDAKSPSQQPAGQQEQGTKKPPDKSPPSSKPSRPNQSWIPPRALETLASGLGNLLKLVFLAALACAVAFFAWKYRELVRQALAQLWRDLRQMWASLWGGRRTAARDDADPSSQPASPPPPSFTSYIDPFLSGTAERYTTEQLIRYSFEALEAWGREEGCARDAGQTPLEFAQQITDRHVDVGPETQVLAELYGRVAYGRERISSQRRDNLRRFWQQLRTASRVRQDSTRAGS
ncbi:MAG: DUF4129 domain-containing protein [Pirellulaceae bacterium]